MQVKYPRHSLLFFHTTLLISLLFVKEIFNGASAKHYIGRPIFIHIYIFSQSCMEKSFTKISFKCDPACLDILII